MIEIVIPDQLEVTDGLAESARNVLIGYTNGRKCKECTFQGRCSGDFNICPAYWKPKEELR